MTQPDTDPEAALRAQIASLTARVDAYEMERNGLIAANAQLGLVTVRQGATILAYEDAIRHAVNALQPFSPENGLDEGRVAFIGRHTTDAIWTVAPDDEEGQSSLLVQSNMEVEIARVTLCEHTGDYDSESRADAELLAAAPALRRTALALYRARAEGMRSVRAALRRSGAGDRW